MFRITGRKQQKTSRAPHRAGNHNPEAKHPQLDMNGIAIDRRLTRINNGSPQKRCQHHEGAPDKELGGRNYRSLRVSENRSKRYAGNQRYLANGEQLLQLRRSNCRLIVQFLTEYDLAIKYFASYGQANPGPG